ncbi:hypothetical protein ACYFX5_15065 [Bremerella sp. T1]|uniref:hypothetical protein n=1 Tax=Bremerella sp. TYQ1 TaxID=3119568 RepID=UPI001CCAD0BF|nr:hypothetical protein [Bremerella volcania]UBM34376.1 hypothetical protein LA756_17015 [Bremerella volcania]
MMMKQHLLERLTHANPGWPVWDELIGLVVSLDFEPVVIEYLGDFLVSGTRLCFGVPEMTAEFIPPYVSALHGMKCDDPEIAGGYADAFTGEMATEGSLFSPAGTDEAMGYPIFTPPPKTYAFQSTPSGAVFYLNRMLEVTAPSTETESFELVDTLEDFTQHCIRCVLENESWSAAYAQRFPHLLD